MFFQSGDLIRRPRDFHVLVRDFRLREMVTIFTSVQLDFMIQRTIKENRTTHDDRTIGCEGILVILIDGMEFCSRFTEVIVPHFLGH
jgi:hypothetical protein